MTQEFKKYDLPDEIVHKEIEKEEEISLEMILEEIKNITITLEKLPNTGNRSSFLKRLKELAEKIPQPPTK